MFGTAKKEEPKAASSVQSPANPNALNALVKGTTVEGTIRSESDLRIDGTVKGKISCSAKVIIGPTGFVDGEIKCQNAVVEGRFTGNIHVAELLNIRESAEVSGEIYSAKLNIVAGAVFNGNMHMADGGSNGNGMGAKQMQHVKPAAVAGGADAAKN